jgi:CRP-like cAMP-binding protein
VGPDASARLDAVRAAPVFDNLGAADVETIAALLRPFSAVEGETLFRSGAPVERLLLLRRGRVGVGDPVLAIAGPGDTLGEPALNGTTTHTATARALEPVEGFYLETGDFDQLRASTDRIAFVVLRRLSLELAKRIRAADADATEPREGAAPEAVPAELADELPFLGKLPWLGAFDEQSRKATAPIPRSSSCAARSRSRVNAATAGSGSQRSAQAASSASCR